MFKKLFIKLFVTVCIWAINVACLFGQRVGIIDVVTRQETTEAYALTVRTLGEHEIKLSVIKSDGTLYLESLISPTEVLQDKLPVGIYHIRATDCRTGWYMSYCIELGN